MIYPPSTIRLRISDEGRRFGIWLPLILIWPVILALAIAVVPIIFLAVVVLWPLGWGRPLLLGGPVMFRIFCSLRGLEVNVQDGSQRVYVRFQ